MTTSNNTAYFTLQANATQMAQDIEFAELMSESLWEAGTKEGVRYDVKQDLQTQALEWEQKAYGLQVELDRLVDAAKSCGFTLHT
jgi:hypothetical protein